MEHAYSNTVRSFPEIALATQLGVGVATVSRWERGTPPTGAVAAILRTVIGSSVLGYGTAAMLRGSGYSIYQLLKGVFEQEPDIENKEVGYRSS